jgi:alanine racemase
VDSEKVLMSHFAESENLDSFSMHRQIETFDRMTQHYKAQHSLANSAAVVSSQDTHRDWIRMGALIYGISPFPHRSAPSLGLKPVMTLASYIKSIKAIKKGDKVGYCGIWQAEEDTLIAIVAMGYGDGYPRLISKDTYVLLNGRKSTIIGRVSMDLIAISLKNNEQAQVGDEVIFWGEGLPVEHVAKEVGTDPREIVTGLTNRVHRIISNNTR